MDAVELGRQVATKLHTNAVAAGRDPWDTYAFAVAEANRRGYDVEVASPGATVLNGARACVIVKDAIIVHESDGSMFDQAFLVAHEIGHLELGDEREESQTVGVDQDRAAEAAPIGLDRVVDYSPRQRREVQMDLFAREFLLPRSVAARLHVKDGLTASQIAEKLGAPFATVAQQLFDALLLPSQVTENEEREDAPQPNEGQQTAAQHRGVPFLLQAGPGTGKTQTLAARVASLLVDGVDPRNILVLTFSNKAAQEMSHRIARTDPEAAAAMWIGTFHAFGLDVLRRFHSEVGLNANPGLLDRTRALELLEREFATIDLRHYRNLYDPTQEIIDVLAAISRAKDEVVSPADYEALAERMRLAAATPESVEEAEKAAEVAKVYARYEELKKEEHCVDFGDLVMLPVVLLESNEHARKHMQDRYTHVLVDEYQDVNRGSVRLLKAITRAGENLWAVGDPRQSIYRFRGASSHNMRLFNSRDFSTATGTRLEVNYRSTPEVLATFGSFGEGMIAGGGESGLLKADRPAGGFDTEFRKVERSDQQSVAIADAIEEIRAQGVTYRDQAVLCTGNDRLSAIGKDLESLDVPVLYLGSLFERPEVRDLLALLSLFIDRRCAGLLRMSGWPEFAISLNDVSAIVEGLKQVEGEPGGGADVPRLKAATKVNGLADETIDALERLDAALSEFDSNSNPWEVLSRFLLDKTRTCAQIAQSGAVGSQARGIAVWQLLNFAKSERGYEAPRISGFLKHIRRLVRLADERDLRQLPAAAQSIDAVRLMTVHGSKGLEFKVVHLPGMNGDTLPRAYRTPPCIPPDGMVEGGESSSRDELRRSHDEEQECLFYVASSRTRDRLLLYAVTHKSNGHRRPLSAFLDRLGASLQSPTIAVARTLPEQPEDSPIKVWFPDDLKLDASWLSLYERCPRRFFYTHVLRIGGRREETAFMQMHEVVREVSDSLLCGQLGSTESEVHAAVVKVWNSKNEAHGYSEEYVALASTLVGYLASVRTDRTPKSPESLVLQTSSGSVSILPNDVLVDPGGSLTFRRIRTGHARSADGKKVADAVFALAARQQDPGATIELVFLADSSIRTVAMSDKDLEKGQEKVESIIADIRAGSFQVDTSPRTCSGCPAFFVCGRTPEGEIFKNFD